MVTVSILSDSPHVRKKKKETTFLQSSAICRWNVECPTWESVEIKYRHYPCHNPKHNYSNSNDVNAQASFHLKKRKKKEETCIKTMKKTF